MGRSEARLSVSIWSDPDFTARSPLAQRLYLFLVSQPDLAHDGVLALRERRWSKSAAGLTAAEVTEQLRELEDARFIVVDEDAEELLIRSFIRRDKVFRQPNVLRAAADHLEVVTSPLIRSALAAELFRIVETEELGEASTAIIRDMLEALGHVWPNRTFNPSGEGSPNPSGNPSGKGSAGTPGDVEGSGKGSAPESRDRTKPDTAPAASDKTAGREGSANPSGNPSAGTPGERGVVTAVSSASPIPVPPSPNPSSLPPPEASPKTKRGTRLPDDFTVTEAMKAWFAEHCPGVDGPRETEKFRNYWSAKSGKDATKVDWVATWRNWMLTAAERRSSPINGRTTGANRHIDQRDDNPFRGGANATYASQSLGGAA